MLLTPNTGWRILTLVFAFELNITKLLRKPGHHATWLALQREFAFPGQTNADCTLLPGHLSPWLHLILQLRREVTVLKAHSHLELGQIRTQTPLLPLPFEEVAFLLTNQTHPSVSSPFAAHGMVILRICSTSKTMGKQSLGPL